MKEQDEYLLLRYWSNDLSSFEQEKISNLLKQKSAQQFLTELRFQHTLIKESSSLTHNEGEFIEKAMLTHEKNELKRKVIRFIWLGMTTSVAAAVTLSLIPSINTPTDHSGNDGLVNLENTNPTQTPQPRSWRESHKQISELALAISDASTNRRFPRNLSNKKDL